MEAATAGRLDMGSRPQVAHFVAETGPGFVPVDVHRDSLAKAREDAIAAADFHRRKLQEAEAVIVSCDSGISTLNEAAGNIKDSLGPSRY